MPLFFFTNIFQICLREIFKTLLVDCTAKSTPMYVALSRPYTKGSFHEAEHEYDLSTRYFGSINFRRMFSFPNWDLRKRGGPSLSLECRQFHHLPSTLRTVTLFVHPQWRIMQAKRTFKAGIEFVSNKHDSMNLTFGHFSRSFLTEFQAIQIVSLQNRGQRWAD